MNRSFIPDRVTRGHRPQPAFSFTPEAASAVVQALWEGNYMETAAALAGVGKKSLYEWLKRGARELRRLDQDPDAAMDPEEEPYVEFREAVRKARAQAEARDVNTMRVHAFTNWQAAAWRLERRAPKRWGRQTRVQTDITSKGKEVQGGIALQALREFLAEPEPETEEEKWTQ